MIVPLAVAGLVLSGLVVMLGSGRRRRRFRDLDRQRTPGRARQRLVVDPKSPTTVYAQADIGQVLRSTDGGSNWTSISTGLMGFETRVLAMNPLNSSTLYVGTRRGDAGVHKTTDGGATWVPVYCGLTNLILSLAVDTLTRMTLYAGTAYAVTLEGLFMSTDGGGSWPRRLLSERTYWSGLSVNLEGADILCLAISPGGDATLHAGTDGSGLFASTDGGATWRKTSRRPPAIPSPSAAWPSARPSRARCTLGRQPACSRAPTVGSAGPLS